MNMLNLKRLTKFHLKKALAVFLILSLLVTSFSGLLIFANNDGGDNKYWDGTAVKPQYGNGGADTPYLITNGEELAWAIKNKGGEGQHYKLTADIYLNDPEKINWATGEKLDPNYTPKKWDDFYNAFTGTIDGDGHVIYGLYLTVEKSATPSLNYGVGLIEKSVGYVEIKNLGMDNIYIDTRYNAAAFVGRAGSASGHGRVKFSNCFVGQNATITGSSAGSFVAYGACGAPTDGGSNYLIIDSCYSLAQPVGKVKNSTDDYTSAPYCGLTGGMWGTSFTIRNSYALGYISHSVNANAEISNNYSAAQSTTDATRIALVSKENMKGTDVLTNAEKMPNLGDAFEATEGYPVLKVFATEPVETIKIWDGTEVKPQYGNGAKESPYLIATGEELAWAIHNKGGEGQHYKLTADIYLNDLQKLNWATGEKLDPNYTPKNWEKMYNKFTGTIDGDGHVIYGLYLTAETSGSPSTGYSCALIEKSVGYVEIKNLGMDNIYIETRYTAAAFVGRAGSGNGSVSFSNCFVGENATIKGSAAGSFVSWGQCSAPSAGNPNYLVIDSCYSLAQPQATKADHATADCVGLTGAMWGSNIEIRNSYAIGYVSHSETDTAQLSNNYSAAQGTTDATRIALVSKENMKGTDVLTNAEKMPNLGDAFEATEGYPVLKVFATEPVETNKYWDGTEAQPQYGNGEKDTPYLISNGQELAWAIHNKGGEGKHYILTGDIYLNNPQKINWATGESLDQSYTLQNWDKVYNKFTGTIDGNGFVIYGLYLTVEKSGTPSTGYSCGLIEKSVGYVEFKNLGMDNIYIETRYTAAAFVGCAGSGNGSVSFSNCFVGENATIKGSAAGSFVSWGQCSAPSAGNPNYLVIDSCYSLAQPQATKADHATADCVGLTGAMWGSNIEIRNSYAIGYVSHSETDTAQLSNNYSAAQGAADPARIALLSKENMQGLDALSASHKMPNLGGAYTATEKYPALTVFVGETQEDDAIWNGSVATDLTVGTGDVGNPYLISNGAQLAYAISSGGNGKYYKLTKDIYLNDVSVAKWYESSNVKEWVTTAGFNGYINGDGHIINGIYIGADAARKSSGLISVFSGGKIEKLGIRNSYIYATHYAGGIAGQVTGTDYKEIDMCFTDETVRAEFTGEVDGGAGGLVGYANTITSDDTVVLRIKNSYSKASVVSLYDQDFRANGLIGTAWKASYVIENSYSPYNAPYSASSKNNTSHLYMGTGIVFMPLSDICKNVYTAHRKAANDFEHFTYIKKIANMKGEKAKEFMPGLDFDNVFQTVENGTPKLKIFAQLDGTDIEADRNTSFASGKGTQDDPFVIETVEQLRGLITSQDTKGKFYSLANDIYVNDTTDPNWLQKEPEEWYTHTPSTAFAGYFEGNGHTIYGLYNNGEPRPFDPEKTFSPLMQGTGLFPAASGKAIIRNVHVRDSYIKGNAYVGAIVGHASVNNEGKARIIGCSADESVSLYGESVGGIVGGGAEGVILNYCYFTGKIVYGVPERANGMVGDIWKKAQECFNCYSVGYPNYRTIPKTIEALYGTELNEGTIVLTKAQMTGENAKKYMTDLNWDMWYTVEGKTPQLKVIPAGNEIVSSYEGKKGEPWSGLIAEAFAGGSGTKEDPFLIETPEQLAYLISTHYSENTKYYKLTADIIINDTSYKGWEKNAKNWFDDYLVFRGHLDGDGHIISGLYFNTDAGKAALIPVISLGASVKRLGIVNSTIINPPDGGSQSYSAAIVAYVHNWLEVSDDMSLMPKISECFADDTVYVQGQYAGGIACGSPSPIEIENCYFTGTLSREDNGGGLLGNSWSTKKYPKITSSYCATPNRDMIGMGGAYNGAGDNSYNYVYVDGSTGNAVGVKALSLMWMRGENAKEHMKGLDFKNVWMTVNGGTPVLRCFQNAQQYSCKREPIKIEISFSTAGGPNCESVFGYAGYSQVPELPTPKREGYKFGGWYCFPELDVPFTETIFPDFNTVLHAKWIPVGFTVNFDGNLDDKFDYNSSAEHYKPGVKGYNPANIYAGLKSMHTLPDVKEDALFLLSYENVLEVGKEYTLYFWMSAGKDNATGNVTLLHATHPQYNSDIKGQDVALEFTGLKMGEWAEYKYTFVAQTPYVVFKTPAGVELFFDEMRVIPTGEEGQVGSANVGNTEKEPASSNGISTIIIVSVALVGIAAVVATVVVITTVRRKRRK